MDLVPHRPAAAVRHQPPAHRSLSTWTNPTQRLPRPTHGRRDPRAEDQVSFTSCLMDRQDLLGERLALVATELAGNAPRHGRPPTVVILLAA